MDYHPNQEQAANEIHNKLRTSKHRPVAILLSAPPQAGKTGALMRVMEMCYDLYRKGEAKKPNFLVMGPSDSVLRSQTQSRLASSAKISNCLLGGRVFHAPCVYPRTQGERQDLERLLNDIHELEEPLVVIWDEAHIGVGADPKKGTVQELPKFFQDHVKALPGLLQPGMDIVHIMVTATPFPQDAFNFRRAKSHNKNPTTEQFEVYLQPGPGYISFKEMKQQGRLQAHIERRPNNSLPKDKKKKKEFKKKNDNHFESQLKKLLHKFSSESVRPSYFVARFTTQKDRRIVKSICGELGIECEVFQSKTDNISDFERRLSTKPPRNKVLIIVQSYKQGKTIVQDHIGHWYEGDTVAGRNDADMVQSVGRTCGYNMSNSSFPINCDLKAINAMIEYYGNCERRDFDAKRKQPMTSTTTKKRKRRNKKLVNRKTFDTYEEGKNYVVEKYGDDSEVFNTRCSKNNSADVAGEVMGTCSPRQSSEKRFNIRYMDAPNPEHSASWKSMDHALRGKYCLVESEVTETNRKETSYLGDPNILDGNNVVPHHHP